MFRQFRIISFKLGVDEERLLLIFLGFSFFVHVLVFGIGQLGLDAHNEPLTSEWSIEVDVAAESSSGQSALPKAERAETAKVSSKMLPQLPKSFAIEKAKEKAEAVPEEPVKKKAKPAPVKDSQEEKSQDSATKENDEQVAKKLKMKEALKRLALEELRKKEKIAKKTQAPSEDPLARIADAALKGKGGSGSAVNKMALQKYGSLLRKQISRHYNLPHTFTSSIAELKVVLVIVINGKGKLVSVKVRESSKDSVFDEYTIAAARRASPFESPPKSLAGRPFELVFTR